MAEFNQLVAEMCIRREYTPPQPLPGFPNNPPQARQEPRNITVTDLMSKILMPTNSRTVHGKIIKTVVGGPVSFPVRADSLPNGYAYLVVKVLQTDTFVTVEYTNYIAALSICQLGSTQMFAIPLVRSEDITITLQTGNSEVDVLLIGSQDAIVT